MEEEYATDDGTGKAGADNRGHSGSLRFAVGEQRKTVSVPVHDDAIDDGGETFALVLSNAAGAHLVTFRATGAIHNSDTMPKEWITRFGRAASDNVIEVLRGRWESTLRLDVALWW